MKKRVVFVVITAIVIALAIWIFLYYNGITGIPGTFSHVDIYCKDCLGKSALECKNTCQNHFDSVNAYLQGYSMKTSKIGDKSFTLCTCEGRIEDFGKISAGLTDNWKQYSTDLQNEEQRIQQEQRAQEPTKLETCDKYYDQKYQGMPDYYPTLIQYQYPYCALKYVFDRQNLATKDISVCDKKFVYTNTNDICKYMFAARLQDFSICQTLDSDYNKNTCMNILNECENSGSAWCVKHLALITGDPSVCLTLQYADNYDSMNNRDRLDCIQQANTFTGNVSTCDLLKKETDLYNQQFNVTLRTDFCYMNVARVKKDISYCDGLVDMSNRDCVTLVAVAKEDISVCKSVKPPVSSSGGQSYEFYVQLCEINYNKILFKK